MLVGAMTSIRAVSTITRLGGVRGVDVGAPEVRARRLADPDRVSISPAARDAARRADGPGVLTPEEHAEVRELQVRDREVRAHEAAHQAAAGELARGAPHHDLQRGPDGKQYAVGGQVDIAVPEGRTPEETRRLARQAQAAANAPADPSGQDRQVAARAAAKAAEAEAEIRSRRTAAGARPGGHLDLLA